MRIANSIDDVVLETRTCDGGCGLVFRCMPSSTCRRARQHCEQFCPRKEASVASFIGRKPKPLSDVELDRFDRTCAIAEDAIANRTIVSFKAIAESLGFVYSRWLGLRDRVTRFDLERRRRLIDINDKVVKLDLSARGRHVQYSGALGTLKPAPKAPSEAHMPAPKHYTVAEHDANIRRHTIEQSYDKIVGAPGASEREIVANIIEQVAAAPAAQESVSSILKPRGDAPSAIDALDQTLRLLDRLSDTDRRCVLRSAAAFYGIDVK